MVNKRTEHIKNFVQRTRDNAYQNLVTETLTRESKLCNVNLEYNSNR